MGLLEAGASLLGNVLGFAGQGDANRTNIKLGREQMAFQERMSNTSYQRAVKDMGAAGLNPMLAYSQGGASAPVGSMPQVQNAAAQFSNSAGQAVQVMQGIQQAMATEAGTQKLKAETDKVKSETLDNQLHAARLIQETRQMGADTDLKEQEHNRRVYSNPIQNMIMELDRQIKESSAKREAGTWSEDVAKRKAERKLTELDIPGAQGTATFMEKMGAANPTLRLIFELLRSAPIRNR